MREPGNRDVLYRRGSAGLHRQLISIAERANKGSAAAAIDRPGSGAIAHAATAAADRR